VSAARSAVALPVALLLENGTDAWGRLNALTAHGADLSTLSRLESRQALALSFELAGERFKELTAVVEDARTDADGYCDAKLRFTDEVDRRRLARVLLDVLSRG
jgi:hypothetical protein